MPLPISLPVVNSFNAAIRLLHGAHLFVLFPRVRHCLLVACLILLFGCLFGLWQLCGCALGAGLASCDFIVSTYGSILL
jgi:uncharacterized membrane protein